MIICWPARLCKTELEYRSQVCDWIEISDTEALSALLPALVEDESYFRNPNVYADNRADPSE